MGIVIEEVITIVEIWNDRAIFFVRQIIKLILYRPLYFDFLDFNNPYLEVMISSETYALLPALFRTIAIAPITFILVGFNIETTFKNPATSPAPHLSLDIPAIYPK